MDQKPRLDTPVVHDDDRLAREQRTRGSRRLRYSTPTLEYLGHWRALTLQQTVPITMVAPHDSTRF